MITFLLKEFLWLFCRKWTRKDKNGVRRQESSSTNPDVKILALTRMVAMETEKEKINTC